MSAVRTEKRVVRPFAGLGEVQECLESSHLILNGEPVDQQAIVREASELVDDTFVLALNVDNGAVADAVQRMQIPEVDVGLAVIATGRSLKATAILLRSPVLAPSIPAHLELDPSQYPEVFGDLRGFDIRVCVVLLHDLQPRPLRPYLAGTWLATRDFSVSSRGDILSAFNPLRLTPEALDSFQLPDGTVTYLAVNGESVLDSTDLAETFSFFIDGALFDLLHANQSSPLAEALQVEFVVEFLIGALAEIVRDIDERGMTGSEDLLDAEHPAGGLVLGVAERVGTTPSKLCDDIRNDPARVRAKLQSVMELGKRLRKAVNRGGE